MKWISVKDRLPPKNEIILVTNGKDIGVQGSTIGCVITDQSFIFVNLVDKTHWMPLPKPPKEENSDEKQN